MKTILNSIAAASLLAMLAVAQPPRSIEGALLRKADVQPSYGLPEVPDREASHGGNTRASASHSLLVYVITGNLQFGVLELHSGAFLPIGPDLPPDIGGGLVPGRGKSLLSLAFSGNLVAIDPVKGTTSVVGRTGLGDCSTPTSPCGSNSANAIGRLDGSLYATDFANNLYSVDSQSGAAKLIGPTGMPAVPFIPLSTSPTGTNVLNESLFSARGKLYANFAAGVLHPGGPPTIVIPPALYQINPKTGQAKWIAPTDFGLTSIVTVNGTVYAFKAATGQVVTLDVATGQTSAVSDLDPAARLIGGATPARPTPEDRH
jgi:hypothetical protein